MKVFEAVGKCSYRRADSIRDRRPTAAIVWAFTLSSRTSIWRFMAIWPSVESLFSITPLRHPVGLSVSQWVEFSKWTVLIGRTGFDTILSVPDPTLSLI